VGAPARDPYVRLEQRVGAAAEATCSNECSPLTVANPERDRRALLQRVRRTSPDGPSLRRFEAARSLPSLAREREFGVLARRGTGPARGMAGTCTWRDIQELARRACSGIFTRASAQGGAHALYLRARFAGRRVVYWRRVRAGRGLAEMPGSTAVSPRCHTGTRRSEIRCYRPRSLRHRRRARRGGAQAPTLAVLDLLAAVAEERPVAVLCDDLQWIDPAIQRSFQWLFGKLDQLRVLCVTTGPPTLGSRVGTGTSDLPHRAAPLSRGCSVPY